MIISLIFFIHGLFLHPFNAFFKSNIDGLEEHVIKGNAQGTTYFISYIYDSSTITKDDIDSIFNVIDQSLSLYRSSSLISSFNVGGKIVMDTHMKTVVEKAITVSGQSDGAFDITIKPLVDYWKENGFRGFETNTIKAIKKKVKYRNLLINKDTLRSMIQGVKIDCDGLAQGYTVDIIYQFLMSRGIQNFLVEVGGEVRTKGKKTNGDDWRVGLEIPSMSHFVFGEKKILLLNDHAVTTAGNYRKYIESNGKRTAHIIDPQSGFPVDNGIISVSVIAMDAITADAWDDVFFVKGIEWTKSWLQKNEFIEVMIIYVDSTGKLKEFYSKGFEEYTLKTE